MEPSKNADFFTPEELAQKFRVSMKTIVKWTQAYRIPGQVKIGGRWRYRIKDIEKALIKGELLLPGE